MAGPVLTRELTKQDDQDLLRIVRGEGRQNTIRVRRAVMVRACADGARAPAIARLLAADPDTVRDVIHAFNDNGFDALDPHWGAGRPRRITPDDEDYLVQVATTRPHKLGRPFTHGIRYFHGCYHVSQDRLWGVTRLHKGGKYTLAALKTIRAARSDTEPIYVIMDNLAATKTPAVRAWAAAAHVELCLTPTNSSWADPIECQFGPLRSFVIGNSNQPNHLVLARALQAYLRWRNAHKRDPDVLAAQRRERARVRSEHHQRWGRPRPRDPDTPGSRSWTAH